MYIYIYIYTHIHILCMYTYIYIYINIHTCICVLPALSTSTCLACRAEFEGSAQLDVMIPRLRTPHKSPSPTTIALVHPRLRARVRCTTILATR